MKLHPQGDDLEAFPKLVPWKQYRVWEWGCEDEYCDCIYVRILEADSFEKDKHGMEWTRNGVQVWAGTWTSCDSHDDRNAILERERECAEQYVRVRSERNTKEREKCLSR